MMRRELVLRQRLRNYYEANGSKVTMKQTETLFVLIHFIKRTLIYPKLYVERCCQKLFLLSTKINTLKQFFVKFFPLFLGISYTHAQTHKTYFH